MTLCGQASPVLAECVEEVCAGEEGECGVVRREGGGGQCGLNPELQRW